MAVSLSNNKFSYYANVGLGSGLEQNQWKPLEVESGMSPWHEPIVTQNNVCGPWLWADGEDAVDVQVEIQPLRPARNADRTADLPSGAMSMNAATIKAAVSNIEALSTPTAATEVDEECRLSDHESRALVKMSADRVRQVVQAPGAYRQPERSCATVRNFAACAVLMAIAAAVCHPKLQPDMSFIKNKVYSVLHVQSSKSAPAPASRTAARALPAVVVTARSARSLFSRPTVQPKTAQAPAAATTVAPVRCQSLPEYTGPSSMTGLTVPHRHAYQTASVTDAAQ
jgi:hypothetical protein